MTGGAARTLVAGGRRVEVRGPADLVARALGPLAALEPRAGDAPPPAGPAVVARVEVAGPGDVPPDARPRVTRWVAGPPARITTDGVGTATFDADGGVTLRVREDVPANDLAAERLAIPALAERLRRDGVFLVHAACLRAPDGAGVWLVPAARGSGKTTLSLMLRRAGHGLLSDDRGFLVGPPDAPRIDPWPEAPRVGDRSLYLLPPDAMPGPRDPVMGKASVPALTPPRVPAPLPVRGFLLPRLVPGPGGPATPVRGAAALAPIASQVVVATDPATAAATLAHLAAVLAARPCYAIPVGDDPAVAAAAVAALA
ncbi:MAG: hypothetical protein JNM10_07570 [Planctomycetia bacterium]|nr:hypothetical protein [Planctomycetia bacterium]